jgi:hypothetical protein
MRGGSYRRGPRLAQDRKVAPGRHNQPRWGEASQRPPESHADTFDWRPEVEVVTGPPRIKPVPFVNLPPDGGGS